MGDQGRPPPRGPALGAKDGIRRDIEAAKAAGVSYDPRGVGAAWTHNFLNLKPWHPSNFRNQAKVWEAEQEHIANERRKMAAKEEFEAEQEYLKTISMLSTEEQEKYKQRQSVSWLYMKPPGYDSALGKAAPDQASGGGDSSAKQQEASEGGRNPNQSTGAGIQKGGRQRQGDGGGGSGGGRNHIAKVVDGVKAMVQQQQLELKRHGPAAGHSPPRGGGDPFAENQRFVVADMDSEEEEEAFREAIMPEEERQRRRKMAAKEERRLKKAAEQRRIEEAKTFLKAAGLVVSDSDGGSHGSDSDGSNQSDGGGVAHRHKKKRKTREKREKSKRKSKRR